MNQINNNKDVGFRGRQCAVIARLRGSASGGDQKRSRGRQRSLPMAAALLLGLALSMSAHAQKVNTSKPITVNEGSSSTFKVFLTKQPSGNVTVTLTQPSNTKVTIDTDTTEDGLQNTLTLTPTNWSTGLDVTVSAEQDDNAVSEKVTVTISNDSSNQRKNVKIRVQDDDVVVGLRLNKTSLELLEGITSSTPGSRGEFTVRLASNPVTSRTINITPSQNSDVSVSPTSLTFNGADDHWKDKQTVTVSVNRDADANSETATISLSGTKVTSSNVSVKIQDEQDQGLTVTERTLEINEGASGSFQVELDTAPPFNRTVRFNATNGKASNVTLTPPSLTFTPLDWNTLKTVTVNAGQDSNADDSTVTIYPQFQVINNGAYKWKDITASPVTVSVIDDDVALSIQNSPLMVDEGKSGSFSVRLSERPAKAVELTLTQPANTEITIDTDSTTSGDQTTLNFTTANWGTFQAVEVTAADDVDNQDDTGTVSIRGEGVLGGAVNIVVIDDEDPEVSLTLSAASLMLNEGSSGGFEVRVNAQPANNRTVKLESDNPGLVFAPSPLTFEPSAWSTPARVVVTASQDDNKVDEDQPIKLSGIRITAGTEVSVTVKDDDFDVGVTLSKTSLTLNEGSSDSFTIRLDKKPGNNRTVEFTSDNTDLTFNPTSLAFDKTNWGSPQNVTVTAGDDADKDDEDTPIKFSGTSITAKSLPVNVKDGDFDVGLALSESSLALDENTSKVLTVRLDKQPGKDRTVELTSNNSDVTLDPTSLTFTTENWEDDQEVTVDAGRDNDLTDDSATVTLAGTGITSKSLTVSVTDDDPGLILSTTSLVLAEGETASFQIKLTKSPPYSIIVVHVPESEMANSDLKLSRSSEGSHDLFLQFLPTNWDLYQTVYVTAAHDDDSTNDSVSFSLPSSHGQYRAPYNPNAASITISVLDDDLLELSADTLTLAEGGSGSFTVKLTERPSENVTVTLAQPNNPDVTFDTDADTSGNQSTLTFTTDNWRLPQAVTVNAAHDADQIDESGSVYVRLPGGGQKFMRVDVNDDDENIGIHLSASSLTLDEHSTNSFTVNLIGQAENVRTITLTSDNSEVSCTPATLTFDSSNWGTAQTVIVSAAADSDTIDDSATISLSGIGVTSASVAVSVTDKNEIDLIIPQSSLTLKEGDSGSFQVRLGRQPTAPVSVTVAQPSNADVTVDVNKHAAGNQNTLTFSTWNWNRPKTVRVTAARDTDYTNDSASISLTATGEGYDAETGSVAVTVLDNDLLELSTDRLTLTEGTSGEITVKLKAPPSENVTVTLSQPSNPDITLDTDPGTAGNQNTLTFTALNSSQPQKVKINAAADSNNANESESISVSLPNGLHKTLSVRVIEDDVGLILSKTSLTLRENGRVEFTVRLAAQPTAEVTVTLAQPSNTDVTVSSHYWPNNTLTFTTQNWNSYETVVVRAAKDADALDDSASITLSASGGGYDSVTGSVAVKVPDDDFIKLSTESLTLNEGGNDTFTVVLKSTPSENVTVTLSDGLHVASDTESETTGPQKTLEFTPSTWSTPQEVTVNALHDDDVTDEQTKIDLEASNGWRKSLSVQIKDDENELILSSQSLTLYERYASWFRIKLSRQPTADVTVTLVQPSNTDVTLDTDQSTDGNQNTRTFTTSDWNTYKKVWVAAAEDTDILNDSANISITAAGGGYDDATASIAITVIDDDLPEFSPSEPYAIAGKLNDFTIKLPSQPSENVVITIPNIDTKPDIPGGQSTLTFTPSNWNIPQRLVLDATHEIYNRQPQYEWWGWLDFQVSGGANRAVWIHLLDRDFELTLSKTSLTLDEGGSSTFTAKLSHQPNSDISLPLRSDNADVTFSPKSLDFTRSNWSANQTVTVSAAQDSDSNEDTATISFIGAGGASVAVSVTEAQKGFSLSHTALTMQENDSAAFQVNLTKQPTADVTVTLAQPSNTDVTVDTDKAAAGNQNTLSFTTSNWNAPQTVHVSAAADDADGDDDSAGISLTAAGGGYDTITGNVPVTVRDDDYFEFSTASLTLAENSSGSVSVRLLKRPPENATVTLQRSPTLNPDVTVDTDADTAGLQNTLTFTPSNWNAYQTVHITAADDTDFTDESGNIRFSLPDGRQRLLPVSVNDNDDDSYRLILSATSLAFKEGWGDPIRIKLARQPTAEVTVTLTLSGNTDMRIVSRAWPEPVYANTLTFTTSNWNTYQTLLVADYGDEDINDDSATVSITAEGGGYDSATGNVSVKVLDDDLIAMSTDSLTVNEGGSGSLTFRMAGQPSENMTFTLRKSSYWCHTSYVGKVTYDTDATLPGNQNTLIFTPSNWSTIRTVTINVADDSYQRDGYACLGLFYPSGVDKYIFVGVIDNDKELTLSTKSLNLDEGGSKTFTVKMADSIDHDRVIDLTSSDPGVTVTPTTLTFKRSNMYTPQTVTVTATEDSDANNEAATISLTSDLTKPASVSVQVTDNDTAAGLSLSAALPAPAGRVVPGMLTPRRAGRQAGKPAISLTSASPGGVELRPARLQRPRDGGSPGTLEPRLDRRHSPGDGPPKPPGKGVADEGIPHRWRHHIGSGDIAGST
ncbi:MAG: hypothetical protein ISN29_12710 [Gammaproteobacteria bacterium AqS3]|nr:hypothetical protein [Gammaproteobacteria bacterium AqS3]